MPATPSGYGSRFQCDGPLRLGGGLPAAMRTAIRPSPRVRPCWWTIGTPHAGPRPADMMAVDLSPFPGQAGSAKSRSGVASNGAAAHRQRSPLPARWATELMCRAPRVPKAGGGAGR